jgi:hypothetical protein
VGVIGGLGKKRPLVSWPAPVGGVTWKDRGARSSAAAVAETRIPVSMFLWARGGAREPGVRRPQPGPERQSHSPPCIPEMGEQGKMLRSPDGGATPAFPFWGEDFHKPRQRQFLRVATHGRFLCT